MKTKKVTFDKINGSIIPVEYLEGEGLCTCKKCQTLTWTSGCVRIYGKVYCWYCYNKGLNV